ncbi:MAG: hypothetical protein KAR87_00255 [Candidatus Aenigmarchaeota archaeon]|nr:hypothetical protein [Candidatus Aenigmarchaeota archaeon]
MAISIETLHQELLEMKIDIEFIKNTLKEDYELSDHAKKELKETRQTPESEYVDLNNLQNASKSS